MKTGKFIVIEGGDGTGKSTCIAYLKEKLANKKVIFTQEPGGTEVGEEIRATLLNQRKEFFEPLTELLLFAASRVQHVGQRIKPALKAGKNIICDRFAASSYAYQICGNQRWGLAKIFKLIHQPILKIAKPDLYVLLDLDPRVAEQRISGRGEKNRLDGKKIDFHKRVRAGYKSYLKGKRHMVVDAGKTLDEVKEAVWQVAKKELNLK